MNSPLQILLTYSMPLSPSSASNASTIVEDKSPEKLAFQRRMNLEHLFRLLNPLNLFNVFVEIVYRTVQVFIVLMFKPVRFCPTVEQIPLNLGDNSLHQLHQNNLKSPMGGLLS